MLPHKSVPFSFLKLGVFYFVRRVPKDLSHHYTDGKISFSLRTRSAFVAKSRALRAAQQLDEHWYHLGIRDVEIPGKHLLRIGVLARERPSEVLREQTSPEGVNLTEAVSIYLRLKGKGRPVTFQRAAERSCGYALDVCGDKNIRTRHRARRINTSGERGSTTFNRFVQQSHHDLKPRKRISGFTHSDHMKTMGTAVSEWIKRIVV